MKKSIFAITVSILVLATTILWFTKIIPGNVGEYLQSGVILILVLFAFYLGYRRLSSEKLGQPAEDEYSKKVVQKAASLSYYISLYIWLIIMYLTDKFKAETDIMFGWGILGMAITFGVSWVYFNFRGIKND